jgi:PAS domain S-box-containing protein
MGYTSDDCIGKTSIELNIWEDHDDRERLVEGLKATGKVENLEAVFISKDGSKRNGLMSATVLDIEGTPHILSITRDITDRKRMENALRENEIKYRELVELAPDGILLGSEKGMILQANTKILKITGRKLNELLGSNIDILFSEDEQKKTPLRYDLLAKGETVINERNIKRPDGKIIPIEMHTKQMPDGLFLAFFHDITEQMEAEQALKDSEIYFSDVFESVNVGVAYTSMDGRLLAMNSCMAEIAELPKEEFIGKNLLSIVPKILSMNNIAIALPKLTALLEGKPVNPFQIEYKDKILEVSLNRNVRSKRLTGIIRDITEVSKAEEEIRKIGQHYQALIENAPDGIALLNNEGRFKFISPSAKKIFGISRSDVVSDDPSLLTHPDDLPMVLSELERIYREPSYNPTLIYRFAAKDGEWRWIESTFTNLLDDKSVSSIIINFRDITDRKEAERALQESEEWFRNLFEKSNDGIFYLSLDGKITAVNNSFAVMHGYTQDEMQKINIMDLDCPETKEIYPERMNRLMAGDNLKFEVEHFHKDGHRIPLEVTAGIIRMGSTSYIMSSHRDISERIKAEAAMKIAREKAEASDKLKTSFLNNISHEVRTPLNGILGFSEIISQSDLSEEELEEAISMVHESSNRLLETITNYMDISLLISGEMNVSNKEFSPGDLLRQLLEKYFTVCHNKNIKLLLEIPEGQENQTINSDKGLILKILTQLISNAIKFTERGKIQIGYSVKNAEFEFFVYDTGTGIGKESEKIIFDLFEKGDQNKAKPTEGSGLGLSISKGIVELLGGKIWMESEPGKGTKFFFCIPFINIPVSENHRSRNKVKKTSERLKLILVAEDDDANFMYISALLRQNTTAEIIHAGNGKEAVEKFHENPGIEIVLMDMKMPEMNGFEATRAIKAINPAVAVIALTAYAMLGDEKRILEAGCDAYLSKPISRDRLLEKLNSFVSI